MTTYLAPSMPTTTFFNTTVTTTNWVAISSSLQFKT